MGWRESSSPVPSLLPKAPAMAEVSTELYAFCLWFAWWFDARDESNKDSWHSANMRPNRNMTVEILRMKQYKHSNSHILYSLVNKHRPWKEQVWEWKLIFQTPPGRVYVNLPKDNSNIKPKSCVSYRFWMVRLGPDTAILSHCGRWFVAWCFEDTLNCWRLPQSNWFAAEQIWSLAEWIHNELTTTDNRWWNYFIKTRVFHGVSLAVFHSRCFTHGVSWLPLKPDGIGMCECSADRDWRTALDWNSQHCPVSSHGWPTIQWCNWQIQRRSATVAMDHQKLPGEYPLLNTALEKFHVSSKLPIWWVRLPPQRVYSDQIQDRPRTGSPNVDPQPCLTETLRRGRQSNHGVLRFPGYSFGIWDGAGYGLVGVARIGYGSIAINTMLKGIRYL